MTPASAGDGGTTDGHKMVRRDRTPALPGDGGITDGHGDTALGGRHDSCIRGRRRHHRRTGRGDIRSRTHLLHGRATAASPTATVAQNSLCDMTPASAGDGGTADGHKMVRRDMTPALPGDGGNTDAHGGTTLAGRHDYCVAVWRRHHRRTAVSLWPERTLKLSCSGLSHGMLPSFKEFDRLVHTAICFDEIRTDHILGNRDLFQSGQWRIKLGQSNCGQHEYSVWLYFIPIIICAKDLILDPESLK